MYYYLVAFTVIALALELIFTVVTYNDYGESILYSLAFSAIITIFVFVVNEDCTGDECTSSQEEQLSEQWDENYIDEVVDEMFVPNDVSRVTNESPAEPVIVITADTVTPQVVPTRASHIDAGRRNNQVKVTYNDESKQACIGKIRNNNCFNVKLIQHTDGTFWACRRNYGICYNYTMAE